MFDPFVLHYLASRLETFKKYGLHGNPPVDWCCALALTLPEGRASAKVSGY